MTNRQPRGAPTGGQFSEGRKPEGDDLASIGKSDYTSRATRDARDMNYGDKSYWDYLEESETEHAKMPGYEYILRRSLGEALRGNDGV